MKHFIHTIRSIPYARFIAMFVIFSVFIQLGFAIYDQAVEFKDRHEAEQVRQARTDKYFDYSTRCNDGRTQPVQYEGVSKDGDGKYRINTSSCSWFKESHPVTFVDRLYCKEHGLDIYSLQSTITENVEMPTLSAYYSVKRWFYAKPFPVSSICYIQSTITMHVEGVDKSQSIKSEPFVPEPVETLRR